MEKQFNSDAHRLAADLAAMAKTPPLGLFAEREAELREMEPLGSPTADQIPRPRRCVALPAAHEA